MAVSNYIPSKCKYDVRGLENAVYLLASSSLKGIDIDNGEAKITSLSIPPIALNAYNVTISDTEELDERYEFSHSVQFSVNGYANELTIGERYYVIVKTKNGEYLLLNALFPCKVEYTYRLGDGVSRTDFSMLTVSNHPTLPIVGYSFATPHRCGYDYDKISRIRLNEKAYTRRDSECVIYTNTGFKEVYFDNGAEYSESYDGEYVTQSLQFSIPLSSYKSSWHYNLLEFKENKYVAAINSENGVNLFLGTLFGLDVSYEVVGSIDESQVNITMSEITNDSFHSHPYSENECVMLDSSVTWEYTSEYDGYECVSAGVGIYLLQKELDILGNETGRFMVLDGFANKFPNLNIIDTFSDIVYFTTSMCSIFIPKTGGTLPSQITLNEGECSSFTFSASCEWEISGVSSPYIRVTPVSGDFFHNYTFQVCAAKFRWIESGYLCVNGDKYAKQIRQYTYDNVHWTNTGEYRQAYLIEADSPDCNI